MSNKGLRNILILGMGSIIVCSLIATILFGVAGCLTFLLMGILVLMIFLFYTNQRYKDLREINDYFTGVLRGNYALNIQNNEEGELSILQNNIYKATVQLREKNEQLEKEKIYLVDMLANISHQLKTPLTSIMMMNELLAKEESNAKRQEFIEIEEKQLNKMSWLIQNLLKLSKLDAGTVTLKEDMVSVSKLIEDSLSPFLIQIDVEEIMVLKRLTKMQVRLDENWTVEALRNIIKNCLEHMEKGGRLEIESREDNLFQTITIKDNGCGISEEELPKIFERFYKGKDSGQDSVGIGLALAKTIINKERGEILVSSQRGKGTCFEIRFRKSII